MKKCMFPVIISLLGLAVTSQLLHAESSEELKHAAQYGAMAKLTLRVVDDNGEVVPNATVNGGHSKSDSYADVKRVEGTTDTNGCFAVEGKTNYEIGYQITKHGYYTTTDRYIFQKEAKKQSIEPVIKHFLGYRWQPWNPTNTVVLKKKHNPIPMYVKKIDTPVPLRDTPVGFDLQAGDWVAPHGNGTQSDLLFMYKAEIQDFWNGSLELDITCTNGMDGVIQLQKDMESNFHSTYEAPISGYQSEVQFSFVTTTDRDLKVQKLGAPEYLVIRVRTVLDDEGKILRAHYGKIYGPIEFGVGKEHRVRFVYYFNPTPNDRNLEFDPDGNLFGGKDRFRP